MQSLSTTPPDLEITQFAKSSALTPPFFRGGSQVSFFNILSESDFSPFEMPALRATRALFPAIFRRKSLWLETPDAPLRTDFLFFQRRFGVVAASDPFSFLARLIFHCPF